MINFFFKYKIIFYSTNLFLIFLYLYPGSLLGIIIYNDKNIQPQITSDFLVSSNHFYVFFLVSVIGFFSFKKLKEIKILIIYFLFLSIILEIFHLIIPGRTFQWSDLFGNLSGVVIVIFFYFLIRKYDLIEK